MVVLALGNPPPRRLPDLEALGERYVADPWTPALAERAAGARDVLLVGTGLTMVDVVAQLHDVDPDSRFTAVSRSGLLPAAHRRHTPRPHDAFDPGTRSLDDLVAAVDERIRETKDVGGDWRDVIDAVRTYANVLWQGLPEDEQARFVDELARRWDTARHRMSPEMATYVHGLRQTGVLTLEGTVGVDPESYDLVVNCAGPAPVHSPGWNVLVDRLVARGLLRPHRLGLGLDLDAEGRPRDAQGEVTGNVYVLGAARKGLEWEVTAIPDLRAQATALSRHVGAQPHSPSTSPPIRTMNADTTTMKNTRTNPAPRATATRAPR